MSKNAILKKVLSNIEEVVAAKQLPVVIFDLDDTLFSTAARDLRIIREFSVDHKDTYPEFANIAESLTLADMSWNATQALVNAGLDKDNEAMEPFITYWRATFFTDTYAALDLPNPGAVDFVNACHKAGALIYYLTGRGVSDRGLTVGMEQGTARALTTRGFPFWTGRCELTLKIDRKQPDHLFKADALACVRSLCGHVVATFDNEPANANMFLEHFPDAINCWLKTTWNPKDDDPSPELIPLTDFILPD